jgi:hypothetical protein
MGKERPPVISPLHYIGSNVNLQQRFSIKHICPARAAKAANVSCRTGELDQHAVAGSIDDAATMGVDGRIDEGPPSA